MNQTSVRLTELLKTDFKRQNSHKALEQERACTCCMAPRG